MDLVDVGDEPALSRRVDLLVVGPQLALDGEEQHFQVPFLREPGWGGRPGPGQRQRPRGAQGLCLSR